MDNPTPETENRYYLQFTAFGILPGRQKHWERLEQVGPFPIPLSARDAWNGIYKGRAGYKDPAVVYKEFDI
jgi:hypothetical protein